MKTTIQKVVEFDAAHRLDFLPSSHKCHRLHGHTYRVELEVEGEPNEFGMVIDYADLATDIMDELDHRCLNDVPNMGPSTTENVARWIMRRVSERSDRRWVLTRVRVYESSTTWAEVRDARR